MFVRLMGAIVACCVLVAMVVGYLHFAERNGSNTSPMVTGRYEPWDATASPGVVPAVLPKTTTAGDEPLTVLWHAPAFSYVDQRDQLLTDRDLLGQVWIGDFIFTQCTTACPVLTAKMVIVQRELTDTNVRFVSFSVDPDHDTPAVLKQYADRWNGSESRWHLLSTTTDALSATAAGMKVAVNKTGDADNPILHSNLFSLVDQNGDVRGVYNSVDPEALQRLIKHAKQLLGNPPAASDFKPKTTGAGLYMALGCGVCHTNAKLAPPLGGLAGSKVTLADNTIVNADDTYLRESILDPGAKIVAGYRHSMPTYAGYVGDPQAAELVEYIKTLKSPATAPMSRPATAAATVVDVVCGMDVDATPDTLRANHDGKSFYFCSETCRNRFVQRPEKYLKN